MFCSIHHRSSIFHVYATVIGLFFKIHFLIVNHFCLNRVYFMCLYWPFILGTQLFKHVFWRCTVFFFLMDRVFLLSVNGTVLTSRFPIFTFSITSSCYSPCVKDVIYSMLQWYHACSEQLFAFTNTKKKKYKKKKKLVYLIYTQIYFLALFNLSSTSRFLFRYIFSFCIMICLHYSL